jgi:hypothetical protein
VGGKELGIGQPEQRAIRLSHVGQLCVSESLAQTVHVARDVDCSHVGQQGGNGVLAVAGKLAQSRDRGLDLGWRARDQVRGDVWLVRSGVALDGIAPLHTTRIEHDNVEVVEQAGCECVQLVRHVVESRHSRTTGVDDE